MTKQLTPTMKAEAYNALQAGKPAPKENKYHAIKKVVDGITFDSSGEARRYQVLKAMEYAGKISELETQVACPVAVNGKNICIYYADFVYWENGAEVVEDFKSGPTRTPVYRLKKKLVEAIYGIKIRETGRADV